MPVPVRMLRNSPGSRLKPPQLVSGCVTEKISHGVSIKIQNKPLKMENLSPEQRKKMESWKGEHKLCLSNSLNYNIYLVYFVMIVKSMIFMI